MMVVLACEEKIDSEDGQRNGFERGEVFYFLFFGLYQGFMYYWVLVKKIKTDFFFFK